MFIINVKPLRKTFEHYTHFLLRRFVQPFYTQGANEVHVIFDRQYSDFNPKQWEQGKRDNVGKASKQARITQLHFNNQHQSPPIGEHFWNAGAANIT